jgi:hypothetical protein
MTAARIPVVIVQVKNGNGCLRMVPNAPLGELMRRPDIDLQKEMEELVTRYSAAIGNAREILSAIEARRRETGWAIPSLYWDLGDLLSRFIESNERSPTFLNGIVGHFTRDLGISSVSWRKILRLRHLVPSRELVDDTRQWSFYRDAPSGRIRSIAGGLGRNDRKPPGQKELAAPPLSLFEHSLSRRTFAKEMIVNKAVPSKARGRSRIEVHLPPEALVRLRDLAGHFGLSGKRTEATVGRALLMAILDQDAKGNEDFRELLELARNLAKGRQGRSRQG